MRYIEKRLENEPASLREYRSTPGASYNSCNRADIREALRKEQGYLCAYCMRRISEATDEKGLPLMQIEHFEARAINEELRLNYLNMLGVCDGNKGNPLKMLHCDQSRGKKPLRVDPRNFEIVNRVTFSSSGEIRSDDNAIQNDLDNILNLNIKRLRDWRREAIDTARARLKRKYKHKGSTYSKRDLNQELRAWESLENGKYRPFCQAAIYYLQNKLSRL
ncbi:MAG: hypothetical protein J5I94_06180 [Phaeodactylibacter sp.]|nr:hypothetical protein [Phaeodactylibacter sp.]